MMNYVSRKVTLSLLPKERKVAGGRAHLVKQQDGSLVIMLLNIKVSMKCLILQLECNLVTV